MLRITMARGVETLGQGISVHAGARPIFYVLEPNADWPEFIVAGRVVGQKEDWEAASLLHALELGVVAAARWIAVELLKDPAPPDDETVDGVALWLDERPVFPQLIMTGGMMLCALDRQNLAFVSVSDQRRFEWFFATLEQALALGIEQGAPWIAAALEKELKP